LHWIDTEKKLVTCGFRSGIIVQNDLETQKQLRCWSDWIPINPDARHLIFSMYIHKNHVCVGFGDGLVALYELDYESVGITLVQSFDFFSFTAKVPDAQLNLVQFTDEYVLAFSKKLQTTQVWPRDQGASKTSVVSFHSDSFCTDGNKSLLLLRGSAMSVVSLERTTLRRSIISIVDFRSHKPSSHALPSVQSILRFVIFENTLQQSYLGKEEIAQGVVQLTNFHQDLNLSMSLSFGIYFKEDVSA